MNDQRPLKPIGSVPAFPNDQGLTIADRVGMSKREHFAALFVAAMYGNPTVHAATPYEDLATVGIKQADVLLKMLAEADRGDVP